MIVVLMGVSGCGKTTIGLRLADSLSCQFYDGDDYHPEENIKKMTSGQPLNDDDRKPWLEELNRLMAICDKSGKDAVLACSALKRKYRECLAKNIIDMKFVYLKGSYEQILQRMQSREGHYMKADMLRSQFQAFEEPDNAIMVDIDVDPESLTQNVVKELGK